MIRTIFHLSGSRPEGAALALSLPTHAFYVGPSEAAAELHLNGIVPGDDGCIHLFGKLTCALAAQETIEAGGVEAAVWRVDISGLPCVIDAAAEPAMVAHRTERGASDGILVPSDDDNASDPNQFCHGYLISEPIPAERIEAEVRYV